MVVTRTVILRILIFVFIIFYKRNVSFASENSCCYCSNISGICWNDDVRVSHVYTSIWQYNNMYGIRLRSKASLQLLLILSGDIETCPGPVDEITNLKNLRGMKFLHLNVRGLWNNFAFISEILFSNREINIFSLSETNIVEKGCTPGELYHIDNYTYINKSRSIGQGVVWEYT